MDKVVVRGPQDLFDVIPRLLGFNPSNSMVVVPVGGGVVARLNIANPEQMKEALNAATSRWKRVLVVFYSDTERPFTDPEVQAMMPGVEILACFFAPNAVDGMVTRDDLVQLAMLAATAKEAEELAMKAYAKGDGALAWCYLDRAEELGGLSVVGTCLAHALTNAVNPRDVFDKDKSPNP